MVKVDRARGEALDKKEEIKFDNLHFSAIFLNRKKGLPSEDLFLTPTFLKIK